VLEDRLRSGSLGLFLRPSIEHTKAQIIDYNEDFDENQYEDRRKRLNCDIIERRLGGSSHTDYIEISPGMVRDKLGFHYIPKSPFWPVSFWVVILMPK